MGCTKSKVAVEEEPRGFNKSEGVVPPVRPPKQKKKEFVQGTVDTHVLQSKVAVEEEACGFNKSEGVVPPIRPPKQMKKEFVPGSEAFAALDTHALQAPISSRSSCKTLAQYLMKPAKNDLEKVRVIYRWITDNISYATADFFNDNFGPQDPESVLKRGTAVCAGYSELFQALCSEMGIPCKKVFGFAKGFSYNPEKYFHINQKINHAWNLVFIKGDWRLIESTWGSGHVTNDRKYEKSFKELYFLTDPEDFVIKHFPLIDKDLDASRPLQLLQQPWSLEKFSSALCPHTPGIDWGFESPTHNTQVITVEEECEIKFKTRHVDLEDVLFDLIERNTKKDETKYVLLRKQGGWFVAKVTPPREGSYQLGLYGKPVNSGETHQSMISYIVNCKSVSKEIRPYPDKRSLWGAKPSSMRYGFSSDIMSYDVITTDNGEANIRIKTDRFVSILLTLSTSSASKLALKRFVFQYYDQNTLVIRVRCPAPGYYKLSLFAMAPDEDTAPHDYIGDFLIDCKKVTSDVKPFPGTYNAAQKYDCTLIEPLLGDLEANKEVRIQLRSEKLLKVMVNNEVHEKGDNHTFDFSFKTPGPGRSDGLHVFGHPGSPGRFQALYTFQVLRH